VIQHAVAFVEEEEGSPVDWVLILQPTAPFRNAGDISKSLRLARKGGCDSVISVTQVMAEHPILMKKIENDRLLPYCIEEKEGTRRQDYDPPAYIRNGAIYLTQRDVLMEDNSIWGQVIRPYVMPEERSYDIDSERDFRLVELVMRGRLEAVD
jgi:CMP-N-acetylneuraminic acid synthetase